MNRRMDIEDDVGGLDLPGHKPPRDQSPEVRRLRTILRAWRAYGRARAGVEAIRDVLSLELEMAQAAVGKAKARLINLDEWPRGRRCGAEKPRRCSEKSGGGGTSRQERRDEARLPGI